MDETPRYRTWIRVGKVVRFWIIALAGLGLSLLGFIHPLFSLLGLFGLPFAYIAFVISLTSYRFGPRGGGYQDRVHALIVDRAAKNASTLDIGCGSASLVIKLARRDPASSYTGLDFWGADWEYSKRQCIENARIEGVPGIDFVQGSAAKLPFGDDTFDQAVSCLTFHEVQGIDEKTDSLKEALRVVKRGGSFIFFDLFADPDHFGGLDRVKAAILAVGGSIVEVKHLADLMPLPFPLNGPRALKYGVLIAGTK